MFLFNDLLVETIKKGKKFHFVQEIRLPSVGVVEDSPLSLTFHIPGNAESAPCPRYVFESAKEQEEAKKSILATCAEAITSLPQASASLSSSPFPVAAVDCAVARVDHHIYVFGGQSSPGEASDGFFRGTIAASSSDVVEWVELPSSPGRPSARSGHSLTTVGQSLYLFGGFTGTERLNDLYVYDIASGQWTLENGLQGLPPSPRSGHSVVVAADGRRVFVFGGATTGKLFNDIYILDLKSRTWTPLLPKVTGTPPKPRYNASAVLNGNKIVLHGGASQFGGLSDVWVFDLTELLWTELKTVGESPGEVFGQAVGNIGGNMGGNIVLYGGKGSPSDVAHVLCFEDLVWDLVRLPKEQVPASSPHLGPAVEGPDGCSLIVVSGQFQQAPAVCLSFSKYRQTQSFKADSGDVGSKRPTFEESVIP